MRFLELKEQRNPQNPWLKHEALDSGALLRCLLDSLHLFAEELEMLAMLVNKNAHCMGAEGIQNRDVALGIFPFVSMLNHSCW